MDIATLLEQAGDDRVLATGGALTGFLFGVFAQQSRFCLRAAVIDFWRRKFSQRLVVWLIAFSVMVIAVQSLIGLQLLDVSTARQFATRGSLSGALIGGLLFGAGMIFTRGCASRLLVLSANGNLRALLSGLVFAVSAQSALGGMLAPLRLAISNLWTVEAGPARNLLLLGGVGPMGAVAFGCALLGLALYINARNTPLSRSAWIGASGTGLCVAAAWWFTYLVSTRSFQVVPVQGLSFSGPSAAWLMQVLAAPTSGASFDLGMLPGVFAGSFLAALWGNNLRLEGFGDGYGMPRYIAGAILMGFGAMLAGGCAVGAGMTGGSIFASTAWIALTGMWIGGGIADHWLDGKTLAQQLFDLPADPVVSP